MYKVKIERHVAKYINSLGTSKSAYFYRRIKKLEKSKTGYRKLYKKDNFELWELRTSSHRIYYTVENSFIVINNIEYEGNIDIVDYSNKKQQQRTINKWKKKLK